MIKAFLFDLDGTLVDTETIALTAGLAAFRACGHSVTMDFMHRLVGIDLPTSALIIASEMPLIDIAALNGHWRLGFQQGLAQGLQMKPGALALVSARLVPMAVVTSSGRHEAQHKLALVGLAPFFDHVITYDDVTCPKPDPEPYLMAARLLGVAPEHCLAFEDSETGSEAAFRAGCIVVQVPDVVPSQGRWAHHLSTSLIDGAKSAGVQGL